MNHREYIKQNYFKVIQLFGILVDSTDISELKFFMNHAYANYPVYTDNVDKHMTMTIYGQMIYNLFIREDFHIENVYHYLKKYYGWTKEQSDEFLNDPHKIQDEVTKLFVENIKRRIDDDNLRVPNPLFSEEDIKNAIIIKPICITGYWGSELKI